MKKFLLPAFAAFFLLSCGQAGKESHDASTSVPIASKTVVKYAKGFRIDYYDHFKVLHLLNHVGDKIDTLHYLLLAEGAGVPSAYAGLPVIHTPVKSFAVMSSSHVGLLDFVGAADRIVGLGSLKYISSPLVRERIKAGAVKEVGIESSMNIELLISMHVGALLTMSNPDNASGKNKTLADAGVPLIPVAEWLETSPLGRTEWAKLFAALLDKEDSVNTKFDSVAQEYERLAAIGREAKDKPSAIVAMPYKGSWFTPAGQSYMAQLLRDAGASYRWDTTKGTGSLSLNFETVAPEALKAPFWFNQGSVKSKAEIAAVDSRFTQFSSFKIGNVYNNTLRTNDIGSNDYWESGMARPQLILADLIRILHPDLLPKDSLYYYKRME
ncbi:MAG: ABC transporter substrate-binding protein [Bacteroidetes bacterium]|nr:ABC transporter substrate-binding protein [Bacteroidota bacterium]